MTYVIAQPCVEVKNGACVEVCPVDCIHTTPEDKQHYIDPDVCIECEQCVLVCPVEAVFLDRDLPPEWEIYAEINAAFFRQKKMAAMPVAGEKATAMIRGAHAKAAELDVRVSVAVVDGGGQVVAAAGMEGASPESADAAASKGAIAVTAYRAASAELTTASVSVQLASPGAAAPARRLIAPPPGTMPIMDGVNLLGAIAVAGGTDDQDVLCCRAGLASYH